MCVTRQVHYSDGDTTHNWELKTKRKLRSTNAHCANCATERRTAHEVRRSRDTNKQVSIGTCHVTENRQIIYSSWFSKHTTRLRIHTCACLKHSNFFNTDRMRKPGLSDCCSHETLLRFGLQQLSQGRVKQLPSNSNLKTGTRALNVIFTHALSALRDAAVYVRPHPNIRSVARKTIKTLNSHSYTFSTFPT